MERRCSFRRCFFDFLDGFSGEERGLDRLTLGEDGAIWQEIHIVVSE